MNDISVKNELDDELYMEIRKKKLKSIFDKHFFSITSLAEKIGINRPNLSAFLSGSRPISTNTAHKIEASLSLPVDFLSTEDEYDVDYKDYIDVYFSLDLNNALNPLLTNKYKFPKQFFKKISSETKSEILITSMPDEYMYPTIKKNELIFIDKSNDSVEDGCIYLFEYLGFFKIRRLQIIGKNLLLINVDNKNLNFEPIKLNLSDIKIIGKIFYSISDHG